MKTNGLRTIFNVGTRTTIFFPSPRVSVLRSLNTSRVYRPAPIPSSSPTGENRGNAKMPPAMRPRSNKSQFLRLCSFEGALSAQSVGYRTRETRQNVPRRREKSDKLIKISSLIPILSRLLRISKRGGNVYSTYLLKLVSIQLEMERFFAWNAATKFGLNLEKTASSTEILFLA